MTFVACFAMMFGSCQKELELSGTTWKATQTESDTYDGITSSMTMDCILKFADATNGSLDMTMSGSVNMGGMTQELDPQTQTANFTYTFDGTNGTMTAIDDETGEYETIPFTYNKKDKAILISVKEPGEQGEPDFELNLVFTQE